MSNLKRFSVKFQSFIALENHTEIKQQNETQNRKWFIVFRAP